jgi:hypothetical protein
MKDRKIINLNINRTNLYYLEGKMGDSFMFLSITNLKMQHQVDRIKLFSEMLVTSYNSVLRIQDPVLFDPWIRDPGSVKNDDPDPG